MPRVAGPSRDWRAQGISGVLFACRVIALAWKKLDAELSPIQIGALTREEVECGLFFGGFAVFHCPLKEDSEPALRMLKVCALVSQASVGSQPARSRCRELASSTGW